VVDAHRVVRRDRPVEEAEPLAARVLLAQLVEDALAIPPLEDGLFERGVVGNSGESLVGHEPILRAE
jgi:hypothetical protein